MSTKTNKSYSKRIKVTRNGKLKTRVKGQNHFNSKKSGTDRQADRKSDTLVMKPKDKARFLPHH
jgi:ribosomal protein L35